MIENYRLFSLVILITILIERANSWCLKTQLADSGQINFIDWSRDGTKFVTASQSGRVVIYDARTLEQLHVYTGFGAAVNVARFSRNGQMIGIGGNSIHIQVMRVSDYTIISGSVVHGQGSVFQLDFSSDHLAMISCGNTNTLSLYDVTSSGIIYKNSSGASSNALKLYSCQCVPSGNQVVYTGDKGQAFYIAWTKNPSFTRFDPPGNPIPTILPAIDPNSLRRGVDFNLATGTANLVGSDQNLQIWGPTFSSTTTSRINIGKDMNNVNIAKDGTYAAVVGASGTVQIWSLVNNSKEKSFSQSSGTNVTASSLSPDSQWFITGNSLGVMYLYKRICKGCPSGTYVNGSDCIPCNKNIKGCYLCINSTHCKNCSNGFWLDNFSTTATHTCKPCYTAMTGCNQCTNNITCVSCVQGYYKDANNKCSTCWDAMNGCNMCDSPSSCLQCDLRYYLNTSNTVKCVTCTNITNCLSCNSSTYCLDCVQGYYEDGAGGCTQCTKNCTNCINGSYCTQCDNGFFLSSGVCALCTVKGCLSCNSTNHCFDCIESMWENSGSCSFCSPPCLQCTTSATTCRSCLVGYYLDGTVCKSCTGILTGCVACKGQGVGDCTACATGFYFNVNTCLECTGVKANCAECNSTTCHICKLGFWYDSANAVCQVCSAGCLTCTNTTDCLSCQVGYYHTSPANTCTQCPVQCSSCESATVCRSCNPMFYYNSTNNNCTKCAITNCTACKNSTTCITCIQGFYLDSANSVCTRCSTIPKCLDCYNSSYCKGCELGFFLVPTNVSCSECLSPCSTCDMGGCFTCELGYFLNTASPKSCSPCAKECEECVTASTNCTRCVPGFYLDITNDACLPCQNIKTGCMSCNSTTCFECNLVLGYFHNATDNTCPTCSSKMTNCLNCLSQANCILCNYGYVAATSANASCVTCASKIPNCEYCLNTNDCQTCLKGFYADANGDCQLCIDGCSSCNATGTCEICLREYVLEPNFKCKLCEDKIIGCEMCNYNPTNPAIIQCTNCITGYYHTTITCTLCSSTLTGCSICNDSNTCLSCTSGFYHSPTNKCFLCSSNRPNCQLCDYNSGTSSVDCKSCNEGYFLNSSFQCQTCSDVGCISCSDSSTCTRCQTGFYLSSGDCLKCQTQYQGCIMCTNSNCLQCGSGFYLGGGGTCQPCSLQGCEICSQLDPTTKCIACNSQYHLTAGQTCELCKVPIPNCLTCVNSLTCQQCESGYFVSPTSKCSMCSSKYVGCSLCTPSVCLQCESGYLLNTATDTCELCSTFMPGCSFCLSASNCLSCQGGFYADGNTCKRCNTITGCLQCTSATQCIFCDYGYFLMNDTCYPCNTTIENCVACASSVMCTACLGNFILSAGSCAELKGQSYPNYTDIKLITEYISETELKHTLQSIGKKLTQTDLDWTQESRLFIQDDDFKEHALTIKRFEFSPQGYSLVFYTDNPIAGLGNTDSMPMISRRLLGGFNMNTKMRTKIQMTEVGVNSLFPSVHHTGTFFMKYKLSEPQFYRSVVNTKTFYYEYFGFIVSLILVILYFVKSMILVPGSADKGEMIPHILCFKMMAFVVYPLYGEYLNYCKGFTLLDLPWFDDLLSAMLTIDTDLAPEQYKLYYNNLNLPSTYLFALGVITFIALTGYFIINCLLKNPEQWKNFRAYLYNLFVGGTVIGSFLALQGAYFNPVQQISVNSLFYILAISIFVVIVLESIYSLYNSTPETGIPFHKVRIILKCVGLSLAYANPLYIFMSLVFLDLCLLVIEYMLKRQKKVSPKLWLFNNILIDCALCMMMLGPYSLISVFIASACILAVLGIDTYIMAKEYQEMRMIEKVKVQQNDLIKTMQAIEKERSSARAKNHQIYFKNRILEQFESEKNNSPSEKKTTNESQVSLMNMSQTEFQLHNNSNLVFEDNEELDVHRKDIGSIPINEEQKEDFEQTKQIKWPEVIQSKKRAANKTSMLRTWNKREKKEWDIEENKREGTFILGDFDL